MQRRVSSEDFVKGLQQFLAIVLLQQQHVALTTGVIDELQEEGDFLLVVRGFEGVDDEGEELGTIVGVLVYEVLHCREPQVLWVLLRGLDCV